MITETYHFAPKLRKRHIGIATFHMSRPGSWNYETGEERLSAFIDRYFLILSVCLPKEVAGISGYSRSSSGGLVETVYSRKNM